jgi:hypothetical protein
VSISIEFGARTIRAADARGEFPTHLHAYARDAKEGPTSFAKIFQRIHTHGRVDGAGCVAQERIKTSGRIVISGCVEEERLSTVGRVVVAGGVLKESTKKVAVLRPPPVRLKRASSPSAVFWLG